ncbi:hypothetical protein OIO90_001229 [Microbotryomycetes sp. JL221]|nr:hypothetical protein OIO90_001229 [Microbotryomycetes sp. JL221]
MLCASVPWFKQVGSKGLQDMKPSKFWSSTLNASTNVGLWQCSFELETRMIQEQQFNSTLKLTSVINVSTSNNIISFVRTIRNVFIIDDRVNNHDYSCDRLSGCPMVSLNKFKELGQVTKHVVTVESTQGQGFDMIEYEIMDDQGNPLLQYRIDVDDDGFETMGVMINVGDVGGVVSNQVDSFQDWSRT